MESQMKCNMSEMWRSKMPSGMDLEISHHPIMKMKHVVNIIIAMERFKSSATESLLGTEFRDENLLNIMLDNIVEEQIVFERSSTPPAQFTWTGKELYNVTDSEKRSLILVQNSMELHAVMLQGGSDCQKVCLNMSTYVHPAPSSEARTVALNIKGTDLYLSCHKDGEGPCTLHLEAVEDSSLLNIASGSDMVRFLFNKQTTGLNITTLRSVPFNDWYISTAKQDKKPVEMCLETAQRHRTFNLDLALEAASECQVSPS